MTEPTPKPPPEADAPLAETGAAPAPSEALASAPPLLAQPALPATSPASVATWLNRAGWSVAALALVCSLLVWQRLATIQSQLARQTADSSALAVEASTLARKAEDTVQSTAAKVALLDAQLRELAAYRAQLEDVVRSVVRVRDENLATDLETALRLAQDQAQLTGSIEPLLAALRTAEQRVRNSGDPRLAPVGVAAERDAERVRAASVPDVAGLLARIDQLVRDVDELPAANSVGQVARALPETPAAAAAQTSARQGWWSRAWTAISGQARDLVRVARIDQPEASMLAPEQVFFLRENLKLRLQCARLALLARQYESARADLAAAAVTTGRYFDPAARRTQAFANLLQQVQSLTRAADVPRASDTLAALTRLNAAQASAAGGGK
ncbi:MAG: uroporphyrinogen-III C-methyltransferase [Burkholderiaceae bacterium]|jgi:uroporphyrin-3 C-methyltransferase|nr:uroporphyrinogen-III C-methyltransferase [Burkholderiaceae bacterium]